MALEERPREKMLKQGEQNLSNSELLAILLRTGTKNKNAIDPEFCIITTDTMRVGAEEQLNKFAQVLGKNVLKAETAEHIKTIYEEYKNGKKYTECECCKKRIISKTKPKKYCPKCVS